MARYIKLCTDEKLILEKINSYLPITDHHSFNLGRQLMREGSSFGDAGGTYYKVGGLKVHENLWKKIVENNNLVLAWKYTQGRNGRIFNGHLIKSRFGETKIVMKPLSGAVAWCDNDEAKKFYNGEHGKSIQLINEKLNNNGVDEAVKTKRHRAKQGLF